MCVCVILAEQVNFQRKHTRSLYSRELRIHQFMGSLGVKTFKIERSTLQALEE